MCQFLNLIKRTRMVISKTEPFKIRKKLVLNKMAAILLKTEHHWKTDHNWKTEQKATIGIPNAFDIPAPTVFVINAHLIKSGCHSSTVLILYLISKFCVVLPSEMFFA